ncbi:MAG: hypothetical protein AAB874_03570 [Patescibacteria group bacterium]
MEFDRNIAKNRAFFAGKPCRRMTVHGFTGFFSGDQFVPDGGFKTFTIGRYNIGVSDHTHAATGGGGMVFLVDTKAETLTKIPIAENEKNIPIGETGITVDHDK